ncbi:MAG: N-acetylmuramic acid 6-phosphate etherase [Candidatus Obscuribacterales bacterium]|nr:N-acetylmuramic acid 6-phosphate etherase [Candidatus Obscuribacterales bacterium]
MNSDKKNKSEDLSKLDTEQRNPRTQDLDMLSTADLVKALHTENHSVAAAIDPTLAEVAKLVDVIAERLKKGGRLIYVGAGTSGRLGVLDASECPPTFGVSPSMVQGLIAGGEKALVASIEGAEDNKEQGAHDLAAKNITEHDVVVGIAASGRTPYVIGALEHARAKGAATAAVVNASNSALAKHADFTLAAVTGAEPITGSTRMKAGTAQKLLLNLISTASMVKIGKVYGNLMVDVKATNEKLRNRAIRIVQQATGAAEEACEKALTEAGWHAKAAIVMLLLGTPADEAIKQLEKNNGHIRHTLPTESR